MTFKFSDTNRNIDVYHFDRVTKEFTHCSKNLLICAGEGLPADSTDERTPYIPMNNAARRKEDNSGWEIVPDYRNKTAYAKDNALNDDYVISELGPLNNDYTISKRPSKNHIYIDKLGKWVVDESKVQKELESAKQSKMEEMSAACGKVIEKGFSCSALGEDYRYRCNRDDQEKMRVAMASADGGKIWVGDVFTHHTPLQATTVYYEAMDHVNRMTEICSDKYAEIKSKTTIKEVELISWSMG